MNILKEKQLLLSCGFNQATCAGALVVGLSNQGCVSDQRSINKYLPNSIRHLVVTSVRTVNKKFISVTGISRAQHPQPLSRGKSRC